MVSFSVHKCRFIFTLGNYPHVGTINTPYHIWKTGHIIKCTFRTFLVIFCRPLNEVISLGQKCNSGADPGFQVRGGVALKEIAPSEGRREHFWGISCEKSRFYAKENHLFSNFRGGAPPGSAPASITSSTTLLKVLLS